MIGILIITHEQLGASLINCIIHILDECPPLLLNHAVSPAADPEIEIIQLQAMLRQLDQGDGVLILTDILGATPANIACELIQDGRVECLTGLNLPMLLRAVQHRHLPLPQLIDKVLTGGRESILQIAQEADDAN